VNAYNGILINSQSDISTTTLNGYSIITDEANNPPVQNSMNLNPSSLYVDTTDSTANSSSYASVSPNNLEASSSTTSGSNYSIASLTSSIFNYSRGGTNPTFYQFNYNNSEIFRYDTNGLKMGASGININQQNIKYPTAYNTAGVSLTTNSAAVQTFNGSSTLTATLPSASAINIGTQFIITNTSGSNNLTVATNGLSQTIYSSSGAASATSRTLAQGNSQIFTAIQTIAATTYGWSMV
jgi:hypothetical protein